MSSEDSTAASVRFLDVVVEGQVERLLNCAVTACTYVATVPLSDRFHGLSLSFKSLNDEGTSSFGLWTSTIIFEPYTSSISVMSMLDKFRKGAQKAGMQASAFVRDGSGKVASGSRDFLQGFSLPGEAEKAAKILDSFLGSMFRFDISPEVVYQKLLTADPENPESALNSIPKAVLQRARGVPISNSYIH